MDCEEGNKYTEGRKTCKKKQKHFLSFSPSLPCLSASSFHLCRARASVSFVHAHACVGGRFSESGDLRQPTWVEVIRAPELRSATAKTRAAVSKYSPSRLNSNEGGSRKNVLGGGGQRRERKRNKENKLVW